MGGREWSTSERSSPARHERPVVTARRRLDAELVRRELVPSRARAAELIEQGAVLVNGTVADKAARQVLAGDAITVRGPADRFVSRAGHKLDHALDHFAIDVGGRRCLDAGASTGGFTDCLLQRGAASVVALDVGHGQLHERIRRDPRVEVLERTNLRQAEVAGVGGPFDVVTADLSFISLGLVMDRLVALAGESGDLVLLVKPQFEAGKREADRGRGVIRDPAIWREVLTATAGHLREAAATVNGLTPSPLLGGSGNVEFLMWASVGAGPDGAVGVEEIDERIDEVIDEVVVATAEPR